MYKLPTLTARFGISDQITFRQDAGGLVILDIRNARASASIALQGAQLMSWTPHGREPVIWLSPAVKLAPGEPIRGGVPVCWPWFGPHSSDAALPSHGFARTEPWEILGTEERVDGSTFLALHLPASRTARDQWPHPSDLQLNIVVGDTLEFDLITRNTGHQAITIGTALHTYFNVSDVRRTAIHGLEGCPYIDKVDGGPLQWQQGPVCVDREIDRIYLESSAVCRIDDPGYQRRIRIDKRGSRTTVVWNPWEERAMQLGDFGDADQYLNMLCVESGNAASDVVCVAPGGEHRLWVRYSVEALLAAGD